MSAGRIARSFWWGNALALVVVLGFAGCGGDDGDSSAATNAPTTIAPSTTVAVTTTTLPPTPEEAAAIALCESMRSIGVSQFVGDEPYEYPGAFEPRTGQTRVVDCAINSGFRSIAVSVVTYGDVAGATAYFEENHRDRSGEEVDGIGDRAWVDIPYPSDDDKSASVHAVVGSNSVSVSNISGFDNPPDRAALRAFAIAIIATL